MGSEAFGGEGTVLRGMESGVWSMVFETVQFIPKGS